jgi:ketosteroid isomerase-like protein
MAFARVRLIRALDAHYKQNVLEAILKGEDKLKYILITVVMVIELSSLPLGRATSQGTSCEQTAKELELKVTNVTRNLDKAAYEQFVSDDAIIINATGETRSKKQQTASFDLPPNLVFSFKTIDVKIRVCGDTNIVTTGKDIVEFREKDKSGSEAQSYWFTRIYEKRQGQWKLVFNQLTSTNE